MMIKTTKVGLALWVLCMQGWLPSLVASCPQALRLTRAEDIFVLLGCIFTVFVFVFFIGFCLYLNLYLVLVISKPSGWWELGRSLFWKEIHIFWQILRLRNGWQVFRRNDGFSVVVNVNIRMSSSLAFDKRGSDVGLYTFPGEHRWAGSNAWCFTRSYIIQYHTVLSHVSDSELGDWHSRNRSRMI